VVRGDIGPAVRNGRDLARGVYLMGVPVGLVVQIDLEALEVGLGECERQLRLRNGSSVSAQAYQCLRDDTHAVRIRTDL
jgi:hypothetical protein